MDQRLKNGLRIFYILSIGTAAIVLYNTTSKDTFGALKEANFALLLLALVMAFCASISDFMRLKTLVKGLGEHIPFLFGLELTFANNFFSAITPFASGGGALQVYMMNKVGISVAKGIAATVMKFIQSIIFLGLTSPLILFFFPEFISGSSIKYLFIWTAFSFFFIVLFYTTIIFWPAMTRTLVTALISGLKRIHLIKADRAERWIAKIIHIIEEFNSSFRSFFGQAKWYFILSYCFTILYFLIQFSIPVVLMWAFHQKVDIFSVIISQIVLTSVMYFVPTPGSSGIAEGGFALIFIRYVPKHILGLIVLIWRFLHTYMGVLLGSYIFLKLLGNVTLKTIMNVQDKE